MKFALFWCIYLTKFVKIPIKKEENLSYFLKILGFGK